MSRSSAKKRHRVQPEMDPRFATQNEEPPQPLSSSKDLQLQGAGSKPLSAAAKGFQREWQRIQRIKKQLDEMEQIGNAHKARAAKVIVPLEEHIDRVQVELVHAMAPWLDQAPRKGGLTVLQHQTARTVLCALCADLAERGHAGMAELHDKYAPEEVPPPEAVPDSPMAHLDTEELRQMWSNMFHTDIPEDADVHNPAAMLQMLREKQAAEEAEREARRAAKQAKRKPSAAAQQAAAALATADTDLRKIYRQLASALHPDRASSEDERQRMTALMSEVNAAYAQKDLVALLNLQWQAQLVDADHLERLPDERLKSLTLLLKQQAGELERERQQARMRWAFELELPEWLPFNAQTLHQLLQEDIMQLEYVLQMSQSKLAQAKTLATLKKWLNAERHEMRAFEREQAQQYEPFFY